ncbi:long-chain-fatty-acid--CoA ligase [Streptomyces sp. NRRL B-24484]|uniref:long-chain-fatty-acid--CoA ligase n=1 Tax=Streptomyces sp. NRRL B-24484 TaxID=1463833 RepID=UPI0004BEAC32|nr:long-chain fatty acid--CoA ligase [Streptomyces sp. NRRL B-24484]
MTLSLACVLAEPARRHPTRTAVVDGALELTYAQLWSEALDFAGLLVAAGVRPGDRVALMAQNTADFPRCYYAVLAAGAVVVPVHLLLTPQEVAHVLSDSGARLLVVDEASARTGTAAAGIAGAAVLSTRAPRDGTAPLASHLPRRADDPAVILYTSGTTGRPKGAVLTQLNLVMNATVSAFDTFGVTGRDVVLGCLPMFHTFGQTVAMNTTFRVGATLVMQPRFDPHTALDLMRRHGVTVFHGVPTMYIALLDALRAGADRPSALRLCVSGGASLPVAVLDEVQERLAPVLEAYGLSETSPVATSNQPVFGTRAGTVGHQVWGVDVAVAAPATDGEETDGLRLLPPGDLGEIVIRGHNVFSGYLGLPGATAAAFTDGWFRTGDLGIQDEAGFVRIVDRTKDLIIRGGYNVYPREVEEALIRHPAVAQVAVIGLPHPTHGEEVCAVVVPADPAAPPEPSELVAWAAGQVGRHKYPRQVEIVESLPLGPSMKVLKRELRHAFTLRTRD